MPKAPMLSHHSGSTLPLPSHCQSPRRGDHALILILNDTALARKQVKHE